MKRTYHTNLILRYKIGMLDDKTAKDIPSSTLHNWKQRDISGIIGISKVDDNDIEVMREFLKRKELMQAAKALYYIYSTIISIIAKLDIHNIFDEYKEQIIKTIDRTRKILSLDRAAKAFGISTTKYYYWKSSKKCSDSVLELCRKRHPLQLLNTEIKVIKEYMTDLQYINWSSASVYYKIMKDKAGYFGMGTFYKYVKLLGLKRKIILRRNVKNRTGIRAEKPLQIIHADLTIFKPINNVKVYIYFAIDNFSRKILSWKASLEYSASFTFENLKEVYEKFKENFLEKDLDYIVDDGSENKAEVDEYTEKENIRKLVAQKDIDFSNSMVEAVNKRIKYDYLYPEKPTDFEQTFAILEKAVEDYNDKPYSPLFGLSPNEVFDGKIPDKNMYHADIIEARCIRISENKKTKCSLHENIQ